MGLFMSKSCSWCGVETCVYRSNIFFEHYESIKTRGDPSRSNVEQSIEVSSFEGSASFTLGYINIDLAIGLIRASNCFYVIDAHTYYHFCLEGPRSNKHKLEPSTYHQCLKAIWKGKKVHVSASASPFGEAEFTLRSSFLRWASGRQRDLSCSATRCTFIGMGGPRGTNKNLVKKPLHPLILLDLWSKWGLMKIREHARIRSFMRRSNCQMVE